ncbi:3-oxoacyl-ACP synthase III family protein [Haliscomenobacter sp.]|uniref:3-oxoacyl-ACP synthase III family protein n=1 Tax=Haliscomenobacter sp. TaxID=2717303 RepID=UPI0035932CBB
MKIHLKACSRILPGSAILSQDLEIRSGLPLGWAEKNTGVQSRHWANPSDNITSIAAAALQQALDEAEMTCAELDLLLYAGASFDHPIPHNSCLIKQAIDQNSADFPCFDVDATCLSFLHALDIAHLYLQHRGLKRVAIVSAELPSRALNPADAKTYTLFGDAAVAVILEANDELGYLPAPAYFINQSAGAQLAIVPTGGSKRRGSEPDTDPNSFFFQMNGRQLITMTLRYLDDFLVKLEQQTAQSIQHYNYIVPHQASKFGNEYFMQRYGLTDDQVVNTLSAYGNCVSASIPLGLYELYAQNKLQTGKDVLLIGTAAGLSIGALRLKF